MKKFNVGCQLKYALVQPTTMIFNIQTVKTNCQNILHEELKLEPPQKVEEYISPLEGNRYIRVNATPGDLEISYHAVVELSQFYADHKAIAEVEPANLPAETFHFLYPSRYCQSDLMAGLAESEFGELQPGYSRVMAICDWIYDKVKYLSGSTDSETSAYDTATERAGVCRDFAHLGIAFCRALNIPARFVSAYAYKLEPPDFHACFEAYLGDRWYLFDATRLVPLSGIIRIGTGRDAADVSFGTLFGAVEMKEMKVFAEVAEGNAQQDDFESRGDAIAIA
ncbi:transglutaminase family protein [Kamptonema sp. UHCC 0994]|uniref:transglutaminase-like domain-containing protein n=1 Tax=Kamptonema sp. UHCC 0994 TaxID=3031329 RepID=UPI0023B91398|nr:transglutaminase family protein [Kamptonema sp. UHCC 0994]MDF0553107.1 transglutaminase family protein [Kamptonema sp. UHCC 0994]